MKRALLVAVIVSSLLASCSESRSRAEEPVTWGASGVCGFVFFWIASSDGTRAVTVNATYDERVRRSDALSFSVPGPSVVVEIVTGRDLDRQFCTDLPLHGPGSTTAEPAATGNGTITLGPAAGSCWEVPGTLSLAHLTDADGAAYPPITIDALGVGCVSG